MENRRRTNKAAAAPRQKRREKTATRKDDATLAREAAYLEALRSGSKYKQLFASNSEVDPEYSKRDIEVMRGQLSDIIRRSHAGRNLSEELVSSCTDLLLDVIAALPDKAAAIARAVKSPNAQLFAPAKKEATRKKRPIAAQTSVVVLPALPCGLSWPQDDYGDSPEGKGKRDIIGYLEEVWLPILEAGRRNGCVYVDRRIIAEYYPGVITAIGNYQRRNKLTGERKKIPPHLKFLPLKQVNDLVVAANPEAARIGANRARRGALILG